MTPTEFNASNSGRNVSFEQGFKNAAAVSPSNTVDLAHVSRLYIGVAGDVKVDLVGGSTGITFKNHPVGYLPGFVTRVYSTGTAATEIIALW